MLICTGEEGPRKRPRDSFATNTLEIERSLNILCHTFPAFTLHLSLTFTTTLTLIAIMQAVRKILKYPFTKLYAFGTFALDAKSRQWPGLSRFSIWILLTTVLLSIAQVSLQLWLAITLGRMPLEASGCYEGHGISGFAALNEKPLRPVTYADIRNQDAISVGESPSLGYVFDPFSPLPSTPSRGVSGSDERES